MVTTWKGYSLKNLFSVSFVLKRTFLAILLSTLACTRLDSVSTSSSTDSSVEKITNSPNMAWSKDHLIVGNDSIGEIQALTAPAATATFVREDRTTQGNWRSVYGLEGYSIANDGVTLPSSLNFSFSNTVQYYTWTTNTSDVRALQNHANNGGRVAPAYYSTTSFDGRFDFTDGQEHQVAFYFLDWDSGGVRTAQVQVIEADTGRILETRNIASYHLGAYLVWKVKGSVVFRFKNTGPHNVAFGGFFIGGPRNPIASTATFLGKNTTTLGNWKNSYGFDGFSLSQDTSSLPSYVTTNLVGHSNYTWTSSTTDTRALQKATGTDRIAAVWYSPSSFDMAINLNDGNEHQVTFSHLDWDSGGARSMEVQIISAGTGQVLDTQTITGFQDGHYLSWRIKGPVTARFINRGPHNAVVAGVFFGGPAIVTRCETTLIDCPAIPSWPLVFASDPYDSLSNSDSARCMLRAAAFYQSCGTGSPVTSRFYSGQSVTNSYTYNPSTRCEILTASCTAHPEIPRLLGSDTFDPSANLNATRCAQRASDYYYYCGAAGNTATTRFYNGSTLAQTAVFPIPEPIVTQAFNAGANAIELRSYATLKGTGFSTNGDNIVESTCAGVEKYSDGPDGAGNPDIRQINVRVPSQTSAFSCQFRVRRPDSSFTAWTSAITMTPVTIPDPAVSQAYSAGVVASENRSYAVLKGTNFSTNGDNIVESTCPGIEKYYDGPDGSGNASLRQLNVRVVSQTTSFSCQFRMRRPNSPFTPWTALIAMTPVTPPAPVIFSYYAAGTNSTTYRSYATLKISNFSVPYSGLVNSTCPGVVVDWDGYDIFAQRQMNVTVPAQVNSFVCYFQVARASDYIWSAWVPVTMGGIP